MGEVAKKFYVSAYGVFPLGAKQVVSPAKSPQRKYYEMKSRGIRTFQGKSKLRN